MAIEINEFKLPWSPQEARDYLQSQTDSFGVFFDLDRCFELSAILQLENAKLSRKARRLTSNPRLALNDKEAVFNQFCKMGVKPIDLQINGSISLSGETLGNLVSSSYYSDEVKELVKLYQPFVSNRRNSGFLENLCVFDQSVAFSKKNHRMSIAHPKWKVLNTSRLQASDPGVQGIPRTMTDIICEPAGYTLLRCDSGQIEPRINFSSVLRDELIMNLIMYYNDAYYGILVYCLMSDDDEALCRQDFETNFKPIEISEEFKENRQSVKRLTNAGSYGSTNLDGIIPELAAAYEMKIINHPKRKELERQVRAAVDRGEDTFYGMFGTPVRPDSTERYSKGASGWKEHVVRCGINNPIQTTASELMLHSVYNAKEILAKAKDTHVCFYKHDEACFYVSDEDMANGVGEALSDITAYNVQGWIPIEAEAVWGVKEGAFPSYIL